MRSIPNDHPTPFTDLNELLGQFVARVESALGDNFLGAYLQGSLALGDADMYSDCDFLIVTREALTPEQEHELRNLHADVRTWPNHWAGHIEGSYVP